MSCLLLLILSGPMLVPPVLYDAVAEELGVAQAHVTAMMPAAYALGSFTLTMPASLFMERFGVQRSFALGVVGACFFTTAQAQCTRFWQLVVLQGAIGVSHCFSGTVAFIAYCNNWFGDQPSTAIAITFAGFGASGALWTPFAGFITSRFGWRAALMADAGVQWCVGLPLAVCGMRDRPAGAPVRRANRVVVEADGEGLAWWLMNRSVWLLALLSYAVLYVTYSVYNSATLFLHSQAGVSLGHASLYTGLIFAMNMTGKLIIGPLYDGPRGGAFALGACALLLLGSAILWHLSLRPSAGAEALAFAIVFGLGYGGTYALVQSKAAIHFGHRRGFKALQGFLFSWQMAGTVSGEVFTPELAHVCSYSVSFGALAAMAVVALATQLAFEMREASGIHAALLPETELLT